MNQYLSSAQLKSLAKGQLLGKYGTVIGAYAIHTVCVLFASLSAFFLIDTTTFFGTIIYLAATFIISLLSGLFLCGEAYIYLKISCKQQITVNDLFHGIKNEPDKVMKIQAVLAAISLICSLPNLLSGLLITKMDNALLFLLIILLIILGSVVNIIFTLMFSQSYYLMLDFPQYSAKEVLLMSKKVMKGNKGRLFYLELSFLPLMILSVFSCCVSFLWLSPYMGATKANFYMDMMKKRNA